MFVFSKPHWLPRGGAVAFAAAALLSTSSVSAQPAQTPTLIPAQMHSITLTGGSGLSMGSAGGNDAYVTHTPVFIDAAWRTWHNTMPQWVYGFSLRAEVDGRTSIGFVPRFEFSRTVGRVSLRPGIAGVIFFAPYELVGPEASLTVDVRLGSVVSLVGAMALDVFFLGSDVPPRSAIFAFNGALGVAIHL